jgi:hypothetical protein
MMAIFIHALDRLTCDTSSPRFYASTLMYEGNPEGEVPHPLLTWRMAKLSPVCHNLSRVVLGAIIKK